MLVTGTSRGIGRATALRLARSGFSVLAAVRRPEDAPSLEGEAVPQLTPLLLDLARDDSIESAAATVRDTVERGGLHGLVNVAASAGGASPMQHVTREVLDRAFEVTVYGTFLLTRALAPALERARGRIVNVGAGRLALPLLGPGFGAKFALEAMSDVLRLELRESGVGVSVVEPGMTRWEDVDEQTAVYAAGLDDGLRHVPAEERPRYTRIAEHFEAVNRRMLATAAPADRVAATIERALTARRPRARYYCGWEQKAVAWLERLTTERVRDAIVCRMMGVGAPR